MGETAKPRTGYVAARPLLFDGQDYQPGDPFPATASPEKLKTLLSTRHIRYAPPTEEPGASSEPAAAPETPAPASPPELAESPAKRGSKK